MIKLRVGLQGMAQTIYTQITHRECYEDDILLDTIEFLSRRTWRLVQYHGNLQSEVVDTQNDLL